MYSRWLVIVVTFYRPSESGLKSVRGNARFRATRLVSGYVGLRDFTIFTNVGRNDIADTNAISAIAQAPCDHSYRGAGRCQTNEGGFGQIKPLPPVGLQISFQLVALLLGGQLLPIVSW